MQRSHITIIATMGISSEAYDEDGMLWIYQGKNDGYDFWAGCPDYD